MRPNELLNNEAHTNIKDRGTGSQRQYGNKITSRGEGAAADPRLYMTVEDEQCTNIEYRGTESQGQYEKGLVMSKG